MNQKIKNKMERIARYANGIKTVNTMVMIFPLSKNGIYRAMLEKECIGTYRIGVFQNGEFSVCYIGRAVDETIAERLESHLNTDFKTGDYYFTFDVKNTPLECYEQECWDFHNFGGDKGLLQNRYHPAKLKNDETPCPICGE